MENTYKLAITPNYGKIIWRIVVLFIGIILPVVVFGISAANGFINPKEVKMEVVFPVYLVIVAAATILVIRKTSFVDTITINVHSFDIPTVRTVYYNEISEYKTRIIKGYISYIITLKEGKKIGLAPTNNVSDEAEKVLRDFIEEFEKNAKNIL